LKGSPCRVTIGKNVKDAAVLIREHDIGNSDHDEININYISKLLSKDWGFYYTVTTNLSKVKSLLSADNRLTSEDKKDIVNKIERMREIIEREPKSVSWNLRAKVGSKKKWYKEVDTQRLKRLFQP
jgi:hypothetical protein